jgi:Pup amidohydrolase
MLLREFQKSQNIGDSDPWLRSLDLEYHRLDLTEGLYYGLETSGHMRLSVPEDLAEGAMRNPPETTRAAIRGKCVQKFGSAVAAAQWDHIVVQGSRGPIKISLLDLFDAAEIKRIAAVIDAARTPDDLRGI